MERSPDQPLDLFSTLLMTLVCAIWGGAFVAIKVGLEEQEAFKKTSPRK